MKRSDKVLLIGFDGFRIIDFEIYQISLYAEYATDDSWRYIF